MQSLGDGTCGGTESEPASVSGLADPTQSGVRTDDHSQAVDGKQCPATPVTVYDLPKVGGASRRQVGTTLFMASESFNDHRFAIALSFPGEHRRFVRNVLERLAEILGRDRVFYDEWYEAELVGTDGDLKLRQFYREQSRMVVPFFSEHFEKDWCQIEWSAIRAMLRNGAKKTQLFPYSLT